MQLIAVSLIGIPASGKTTFARKLLEMSRLDLLDAGVVVISFDEHLKIDFSELSEGDYKRRRESWLKTVEDLMKQLRNEENPRWNEILSSHQLNFHHVKTNRPTLIILDDNFYFRSMRQRIRAMCRSLQCAHFQIFLKSSLDDAKRRNLKRPSPVPDPIILKMFEELEEPSNPSTITIESLPIDDETLLQLLKERIESPETLVVPDGRKTPQHQSLLHDIDIMTRKELSARIKNLQTTENISQACATLNRKRKEFLETLRNQEGSTADAESLRAAFNCFLDE